MKLSELSVLLPCHSLEDFPVYHEGREADELMAAWCALWHPALLAGAGALPAVGRVDVPPESLEGRLITVPPFCVEQFPAGFVARAETEALGLVRQSTRDEAVAAALNAVEGGDQGVDAELAADFLALGFCRLQIELLTRQMRYSVNIDETHFAGEAILAAQAAVGHDEAASREHMAQCFETLNEARNRFYPVDVQLIDLTLLAPATLGDALVRELASGRPTNLLATAALLGELAGEQPSGWSSLLKAIDAGTVCVLGGEDDERALPLLPIEAALASLSSGARHYETLLGRRPQVYGRRRAGLWPGLPQILARLGYQAALHVTLDDGRFPVGPQSKTRWEGLSADALDALCQVPIDAAKSETFLGLSRKMADTMDNDHVATVVLAHWPGGGSPWYDDLRRITRLSGVLGKFVLLDDYFAHTDMPGRLSKFEPDQYRTPYLKQAIMRRHSDAVSAFVREHQAQAAGAAVQAIGALAELARGTTCRNAGVRDPADHDAGDRLRGAIERFSAGLPRGTGASGTRRLVINPLSFTRRVGIELADWERPPAIVAPVLAAGTSGDRHFAVVEVPAMGFAWIEPAGTASASRGKPIARDDKLINEFLELTVSQKTGGIKSIFDYGHRGNQLSQQLACRLPAPPPEPGSVWRHPDDDVSYSSMRAESVEIVASCPAFGEIVSRGLLVDGEGKPLARFRQSTQVWAGSRVIRIDVELDEVETPRADPWNSYVAARFAWPDATADLWRGVGLTRQRTEASRLEAPEYVDIESPGGHMTILTGGHPYHRRTGTRMLDSILMVRGETARRFRVGIGVGLPQPAAAAIELLTPAADCSLTGPPGAAPSGWFFHVDAKNVVATHWEPLREDRPDDPADAANERPLRGFRVRLLETAGRSGRVTLRAFRPVARARQVDFHGQTLVEAPVEGDKIALDFGAHEWIEVEAAWSS